MLPEFFVFFEHAIYSGVRFSGFIGICADFDFYFYISTLIFSLLCLISVSKAIIPKGVAVIKVTFWFDTILVGFNGVWYFLVTYSEHVKTFCKITAS